MASLGELTGTRHMPLSPGYFQIQNYNAVSAQLQREVGVEPDECMRIQLMRPTKVNERTDLVPWLTGLTFGDWVSPTEGNYLHHDIQIHWGGVRRLHPESLPFVKSVAHFALGQYLIGETKLAGDIGLKLDYVVDVGATRWHYAEAAELCGWGERSLPDYEIQSAHVQAMREAEERWEEEFQKANEERTPPSVLVEAS